MKKYSNFQMLIEYLLIAFSFYLIASAVICTIIGCSYREVLCSQGQIVGLVFVYLWIPIPRMCDMEDRNNRNR